MSLGFVVMALLEFALVILIYRRMLLNKSDDKKVRSRKNEKRNKSQNTNIIGPMKSKMIPSNSTSIKSNRISIHGFYSCSADSLIFIELLVEKFDLKLQNAKHHE